MSDTYVIMAVDIIGGGKEPIGVTDDIKYAVEISEAHNKELKTTPYQPGMFGEDLFAGRPLPRSTYWYVKSVPRVVVR